MLLAVAVVAPVVLKRNRASSTFSEKGVHARAGTRYVVEMGWTG